MSDLGFATVQYKSTLKDRFLLCMQISSSKLGFKMRVFGELRAFLEVNGGACMIQRPKKKGIINKMTWCILTLLPERMLIMNNSAKPCSIFNDNIFLRSIPIYLFQHYVDMATKGWLWLGNITLTFHSAAFRVHYFPALLRYWAVKVPMSTDCL